MQFLYELWVLSKAKFLLEFPFNICILHTFIYEYINNNNNNN